MSFLAYPLLGCVFACAASASELLYTPINPQFGGNSLNASALQYEASAQKPNAPADPCVRAKHRSAVPATVAVAALCKPGEFRRQRNHRPKCSRRRHRQAEHDDAVVVRGQLRRRRFRHLHEHHHGLRHHGADHDNFRPEAYSLKFMPICNYWLYAARSSRCQESIPCVPHSRSWRRSCWCLRRRDARS